MFETKLREANQSVELMEHGFVRTLYKRCRINAKKIEDANAIEAKRQMGGKVTETQQEKVNKKVRYQSDIASDLVTLELFLQHFVAPVTPQAEEAKQPVPPIENP